MAKHTMKMKLTFPKVKKGGPGSGDFGHRGRPGQIGGSSGGGSGSGVGGVHSKRIGGVRELSSFVADATRVRGTMRGGAMQLWRKKAKKIQYAEFNRKNGKAYTTDWIDTNM